VSTGDITINTNSTSGSELVLTSTSGFEFQIDGGGYDATAGGVDLNALAGGDHTLDIRLDGSGDNGSTEVIATITFNAIVGDGASTGTLVFDIGQGMFSETSTVASATAPIDNFMTITTGNQTFDIVDSTDTLIGSVTYNPEDSLSDIADYINSNFANITATAVDIGTTFKLQISHDSGDSLTFNNDSDNLLTELNLASVDNALGSANIDGASNGSDDDTADVGTSTITVTDSSGAEDLKLFYSGNVDLSGVQIDFTIGFATSMFFAIDKILDSTSGTINADIDGLTDQNEENQERIDDALERIELHRQLLVHRFSVLEAALARAQAISDNLTVSLDSLTSKKR
jgi:hypothetical protein